MAAGIRGIIDRVLGRGGNAEADVAADPALADSREHGGDPGRRPAEGGTTGTSEGGEYVGRVAGDEDFSGETGADRRGA